MAKKDIRLDKYLSDMGQGSRSVIKNLIKKGHVKIDGNICRKPEEKIKVGINEVYLDDKLILYEKYVYYMLNKPKGVVSATKDNYHKTVIDLINDNEKKDIFPVGRLDIDTEGLLLITNDGDLAHTLLSPKKGIGKTYYVEIDKPLSEKDIQQLEIGVYIDNNYLTMASIVKLIDEEDTSKIQLTIFEGKFHQVKQMIKAVGKSVLYLKRISMDELHLDGNLKLGEYRKLTKEELELLKDKKEK